MMAPASVGSIRHPRQMQEFVEFLITYRAPSGQIAVGHNDKDLERYITKLVK